MVVTLQVASQAVKLPHHKRIASTERLRMLPAQGDRLAPEP